ncbi:GntR family transcriptional regulator [Escherichia coli]|uniref:GntR family transcriptional regulator n=1 Tax=Enterobacteriaceae TaxID=543 RepID=UPI0003DCBF0C|nr:MULTISPECIES: GntR family transcriptional regulator [Enterobacteriaceae]CDK44988.1 hypothetical protein [Escherichia coli IS1]HCJ7771030.1 GntR family transcriptional regulator [Citrobacter freundii]EEV5812745.1 GntR family transcriptional regulator [Escherichia coli]EFC1824556.1 GntR family transcriptional regulator [Escherichia coli]EFF2199014.1 GntR family transcriptional regulator [Escherichia coli]
MIIENIIAAEINAGTDLSERKLAEKHGVSRSVVRRVKTNIEKYTVVEVAEAKAETVEVKNVEVVDVKEATKIVSKIAGFGIDNIDKLLKSKSSHKLPSAISVICYQQAEGDFEKFSKRMLGKSKAYIRDQFLRVINSLKESK